MLTLNGNAFSGNGSVTIGNGTNTGTVALTANAAALARTGLTVTSNLDVNQAADVALFGVLAGTGTLQKSNTNNLTLAAANTLSGFVQLNAGRLTVSNADTALGTAVLRAAGDATLAASLSGRRTLTNSVTLNAATTLTVDATASELLLNGAIVGSGNLAIAGDGAYATTFGGANVFGGTVTVANNAQLIVANAAGLGGVGAGTTVAAGGSLLLSGGITTNREPLTLAGTGVAGQGALANFSGSNTFWGPVTLAAASEIRSLQNGQTLTLASRGGIAGTDTNLVLGGPGNLTVWGSVALGAGSLTKDGAGTAYLVGTNSYAGATNVNEGTLQVFNAASLPAASVVNLGLSSALQVVTPARATLANNLVLAAAPSTISLVKTNPAAGTGTQLDFAGVISGGHALSTLFQRRGRQHGALPSFRGQHLPRHRPAQPRFPGGHLERLAR